MGAPEKVERRVWTGKVWKALGKIKQKMIQNNFYNNCLNVLSLIKCMPKYFFKVYFFYSFFI